MSGISFQYLRVKSSEMHQYVFFQRFVWKISQMDNINETTNAWNIHKRIEKMSIYPLHLTFSNSATNIWFITLRLIMIPGRVIIIICGKPSSVNKKVSGYVDKSNVAQVLSLKIWSLKYNAIWWLLHLFHVNFCEKWSIFAMQNDLFCGDMSSDRVKS